MSDAVIELLAVLDDVIEEALEPDASGPPERFEITRETLGRLIEARARVEIAGPSAEMATEAIRGSNPHGSTTREAYYAEMEPLLEEARKRGGVL